MQATRSKLRRLTATLLPAALLWLWAACAVICGQESVRAASASTPTTAAGVAEVKGAQSCEGCPFASFPKATATERAAFDADPQTSPADLPAAANLSDYPGGHSAFIRARRQPPSTAPPLELLSALRI